MAFVERVRKYLELSVTPHDEAPGYRPEDDAYRIEWYAARLRRSPLDYEEADDDVTDGLG